jgi:hypothetical protein
VDQILGQVLRNAVWERLDRLTDVANDADAPALISVARSELPRLAEGWRAILRVHEPDERGDCPTCSTRWHKCKAPCSVWQVAHDHLVAGGLAHFQHSRRYRRRRAESTPDETNTSTTPATRPTGRHALIGRPHR